jgi:hypothetical protein
LSADSSFEADDDYIATFVKAEKVRADAAGPDEKAKKAKDKDKKKGD